MKVAFTIASAAVAQELKLSVDLNNEVQQGLLEFETPTPSTYKGCKCKSECGTSVDDAFNCDWCYTEDNCGTFSVTRASFFDYCTYPPDTSYESKSAAAKQAILWAQVVADKTQSTYPTPLDALTESMQDVFDNQWDVLTPGRKKVIHGVGAVCQVAWTVPNSSPYTGIFGKGEKTTGLIRMGSATPFTASGGQFTPGIGWKFMRDGVHSANWVSLYNLEGQESRDFFAHTQTNHLPQPASIGTKTLAKKFMQASNCATMVGLSDAAKYNTAGEEADTPLFPYNLQWEPQLHQPDEKVSVDDQLSLMEGIPKGSVLYSAVAYASPDDTEGTHLGDLVTTSECTRSMFGDTSLFFRHQRIEEDLVYHPEWMDSAIFNKGCPKKTTATPPKNCKQEAGPSFSFRSSQQTALE